VFVRVDMEFLSIIWSRQKISVVKTKSLKLAHVLKIVPGFSKLPSEKVKYRHDNLTYFKKRHHWLFINFYSYVYTITVFFFIFRKFPVTIKNSGFL
jgi:hypothetical protein